MSDPEKRAFQILLVLAAIAIVISMVAGPLSHTAVAIGAAGGAILFALALLAYSLWSWPGKR